MNQFQAVDERWTSLRTPFLELASVVQRLCVSEGANPSKLSGLKFFKLSQPDEPSRCFYEPCIAIILSGAKRVMFDQDEMLFQPGDFFVTSIDVPTSAHVIEASAAKPYLSLVMRIDLQRLHDVAKKMGLLEPDASVDPVGIARGRASEELLDAFSRLVDLNLKPDSISLLADIIQSEIYVRLLQSEAGNWLTRMASEGYRATGVVRALEWLKGNYMKPLRIEELAALAAMASSTFHHNFRRLTGTSPLQYQKSLRLYAARNLMLTERVDANIAAVRVGYESVPQFSREYSRMFGAPPRRDVQTARQR
ncbi:AraC family transcriptional regulator [Agrobacterium sp. 16-172Ci]|uniref:AraC family transcriptional regulator n=1 Tax=Agrobacterium salinitolerans TaxID=1183413 RepID=A0A9X3R2E7_9HYPH|nr:MULTISPECIES: AraC family transcriptional regulator [Agrobacterium]MCZ7854640.1 AraC family transcriptional regulator [Agrobacterium salinitolerans]MCZ7939910.1 AraC family transcriptional regulator [Agrobacterium salinitolerans]TRA84252.1 AraC family transcriptional regulator [Agrobacterium salinitolerans]